MSRIGKLPILVPDKVQITLDQGRVKVKGPLGELANAFDLKWTLIEKSDKSLLVTRKSENRFARAEQGMVRALLANMVKGVVQGFTKDLSIVGVGYSAEMKGKGIKLKVGYSHEVIYEPPAGIKVECPAPTKIKVSGADKQIVGEVAAKIRAYRPPEPYKGKGIKYDTETILRKAGKSGAK